MLSHFLRAVPKEASTAVQFQDSSTSTASTITLPSNLTSKDLLILFDFSYSSSTSPTYVLPSGWTSIANQTDTFGGSGQTRAATSYIAGDSSLSGTSITGMTAGSGGGVRKICVVFRNAAYSSVGTNTYNASSATASSTLVAGTSPYLGLAFVGASGTASLPTVPSGGSYTPASSGNVFCYYTIDGGAGTYTTNDSGTVTAVKLLTLNVTNI